MGAEITTRVSIGRNTFRAEVLLETSEIIIRGDERLKIPFKVMRSLAAKNGALSFTFGGKSLSIDLGNRAITWFKKISNPKSVMDKLGIKPDSVVSIINLPDKNFISEVKKITSKVTIRKPQKGSDLVFIEANIPKEVERLSSLKKFLKPNGAIWVVSLKGKAATIKDVEIMRIGKKCGMVDTKVVGFSETHSALKFVIPVLQR